MKEDPEPEMSDLVYTGSCYSKQLGREFVCSTIRRTYESRHPYMVTLVDYRGKVQGSILSESWDDALIKSLNWRIQSSPEGYKSSPDQDVITSEKIDATTQAEVCPKRLRELHRIIKLESYNRQMAELYLINFYGFFPINPKEWVLDGIKCIFNLHDEDIYGGGFTENRDGLLGGITPSEWYDEFEDMILINIDDYYEKMILRRIDLSDEDNIVVTNLSSIPDKYNFTVIGLNCEADTRFDYSNNQELFDQLDSLLKDTGVEKVIA